MNTEYRMIDEDEMIALLAQAVAGKESFVYPEVGQEGWQRYRDVEHPAMCFYRRLDDPTQPACIIGRVFDMLGILHMADEGSDAASVMNNSFYPHVGFTDAAISVALRAQQEQDNGAPWAVAYTLAVTAAKEG